MRTPRLVPRLRFGLALVLAGAAGLAPAAAQSSKPIKIGFLAPLTRAAAQIYGVTEANWRDAAAKSPHFVISESPRFVGRAIVALAADPDRARWTGQSLFAGGSRRSTGSPTSTARGRTAGAT